MLKKTIKIPLYSDGSGFRLENHLTILSTCMRVCLCVYTFAVCLGEELVPGNFGLLWERLQVVPGFHVDYTV